MQLIFLHGLGQDATSWDDVIKNLADYDTVALNLFENKELPESLESLLPIIERQVSHQKDYLLVGLSLGAILALKHLPKADHHLKGLILSGGQYRFKGHRAYRWQRRLFKCLPRFFFKRFGIDKTKLLTFYASMAELDMTSEISACTKPVQIICGDKDRANWSASQEMTRLFPNAHFQSVKNGHHQLNREHPYLFAQLIKAFLKNENLVTQ